MRSHTSLEETGTVGARTEAVEKLSAYWALIKSRQTLLLVATGMAGYLSAQPHAASLQEAGLMLLSLFGAISGTTAINMVLDRDIDARMARTADRPLPTGTVSPSEAVVFGGVLVAAGVSTALGMRAIFGVVIAIGVLFDLVVYTLWLKRRSPWSIVFGGISGGMPILAGRALSVGQVDELGLLLALSVLTWIPAHILTLSMRYADDYRRAGVPTWPTVHGFDSARRFIAVANGLRILALVGAGWLLRVCPYSLALLGLSGIVMLGLSIWSLWRPSGRLNDALFKFASIHMLGSTVLIMLGAVI